MPTTDPPPSARSERPFRSELGVGLVLALVAVFVGYAPTLGGFFQSDDFSLLKRAAGEGIFATWGQVHGGFLRPVVALAFAVDFKLWGLDPLGFRTTNLILHALNSALVGTWAYLLAWIAGVGRRRALGAGLVGLLLFALHPSHSEPVAWISGRSDLLACLFQVSALLAVTLYLRPGRPGAPGPRVPLPGVALAGLATLLFAVALFAKETALAWPGLAVVTAGYAMAVDPIGRGRIVRRVVLLSGVWTLLLGAYFLVRYRALGVWLGGYGTERHLSLDLQVLLDHGTRFVLRSILPGTPATLRGVQWLQAHGWAVAAALALGGAGLLWLISRRPRAWLPILGFGLAGFVVALATAWSVFRLPLFEPKAERVLYLPSVFVCVALAVLLADALPESLPLDRRRARRLTALLAGLLVVCAAWGLVAVRGSWRTAADLTGDLVASAARNLDGHEVLWVMGLPGSFRGRYVLQNGLAASIALFGEAGGPRAVLPITSVGLDSADPRATVGIDYLGRRRVRLTLTLEGGYLEQIRAPKAWTVEGSAPGEPSPTVVLEGPVPPRVTLAAVEGRAFRILVPARK